MIGMLVRDQDRIQLLGVFLDSGKAGEDVALGEARVD